MNLPFFYFIFIFNCFWNIFWSLFLIISPDSLFLQASLVITWSAVIWTFFNLIFYFNPQLASSLGPRFYSNIFKCKQISETGAQQVLTIFLIPSVTRVVKSKHSFWQVLICELVYVLWIKTFIRMEVLCRGQGIFQNPKLKLKKGTKDLLNTLIRSLWRTL